MAARRIEAARSRRAYLSDAPLGRMLLSKHCLIDSSRDPLFGFKLSKVGGPSWNPRLTSVTSFERCLRQRDLLAGALCDLRPALAAPGRPRRLTEDIAMLRTTPRRPRSGRGPVAGSPLRPGFLGLSAALPARPRTTDQGRHSASLSGTMAISGDAEGRDADADRGADKKGGVLRPETREVRGRRSHFDWPLFAEKARELIAGRGRRRVRLLASVSRKSVLPV